VTTYSSKAVWGARAVELLLAPLAWVRRRVTLPELPASPVIVVIEPFQLGDVLSLAVMIDPILAKFPEARIVLWCHTKAADVFRGDKRIWKTVTAPFPWSSRGSKRGSVAEWRAVLASCREVSRLRPDVGIDPRGDIRSQAMLLLGGCAARIGYRRYVASNMELRGLLLTDALPASSQAHRYLSNLETLAPLLGVVPALRLPAYGPPRVASAGGTKTVLIHPGAGWPFRLWPVERWIELVSRLVALGNVRVLQVAGPGEKELAAEISAGVPGGVETRFPSFDELLSTFAAVDLLICLDSGPMNAAALMNVPILALFGPGIPELWRPLSEGSAYFQHVEAYPCFPCTQIVCVHPEDPCIRTITVDEMFQKAAAILGISPPAELVQIN